MTEHKEVASASLSVENHYVGVRQSLENLLRRRFFISPSFEIYGGVAGLYDYGPSGCALKNAIESLWRSHFVLEEDLLEIAGPCLTPYAVLKTSGHVDRFSDAMAQDVKNKECYRADKLVEDWVEQQLQQLPQLPVSKKEAVKLTPEKKCELELLHRIAGTMSCSQLDETISKYQIKAPGTGNDLSPTYMFNLMFPTKIGPKAGDELSSQAFLRPETAQGIFVNFRRLLEFNGGRMPFGAAQIGTGFRNEIAPRNGLLRVREFQMGEIEFFVDPLKKDSFPKFKASQVLRTLCMPLLTAARQLTDGTVIRDLSLEEAVGQKVIANETLAYFLGRTYQFLILIGIQESGIRFRQHMATEMAHYACDCWDAELLTSYGWVEVAGHADRSAYDLTRHSEESKTELTASRIFEQPKEVTYVKTTIERKLLGPAFKKQAATVIASLEGLEDARKLCLETELASSGKAGLMLPDSTQVEVSRSMVKFERVTEMASEESYIPSVIEPSFGFGRIIYSLLEHSFRKRAAGTSEASGNEDRNYLALPPVIAPTKCSILPISPQPQFVVILDRIQNLLKKNGVACKLDSSGATIGKRYARTDEIGIPFGITVDFETLQDNSVTLRERDSMQQVRLQIEVVGELLAGLCRSVAPLTWQDDVVGKFPMFGI